MQHKGKDRSSPMKQQKYKEQNNSELDSDYFDKVEAESDGQRADKMKHSGHKHHHHP